jgi:hypothetical protein
MTGKTAKICCAILVVLFGAFLFTAWQSKIIFANPTIEDMPATADGCLDCHDLGSTIVTDPNKQFAPGAAWHGNHAGFASNDCTKCHPGGNTAEDVPIGDEDGTGCSTSGCHSTLCDFQDFHEEDPTYLASVTELTCYDCHPECEPAETTTTTTTADTTTTTTADTTTTTTADTTTSVSTTTSSSTTTTMETGDCSLTIAPETLNGLCFFPRVAILRIQVNDDRFVRGVGGTKIRTDSADILVIGPPIIFLNQTTLLQPILIGGSPSVGTVTVTAENLEANDACSGTTFLTTRRECR